MSLRWCLWVRTSWEEDTIAFGGPEEEGSECECEEMGCDLKITKWRGECAVEVDWETGRQTDKGLSILGEGARTHSPGKGTGHRAGPGVCSEQTDLGDQNTTE